MCQTLATCRPFALAASSDDGEKQSSGWRSGQSPHESFVALGRGQDPNVWIPFKKEKKKKKEKKVITKSPPRFKK